MGSPSSPPGFPEDFRTEKRSPKARLPAGWPGDHGPGRKTHQGRHVSTANSLSFVLDRFGADDAGAEFVRRGGQI
jgi:hypothetical protein